jgi:uncharacterized protein involved in exopolysaccharide biosynthesis
VPDTGDDLTVRDLARWAWRRKNHILAAIVGGFAFGAGVSLLLPKKYESQASFIGVGSSRLNLSASLGGLGAIASQLGISALGLGGSDASSLSPYFYADLLTTDTILAQLADVPLRADGDTTAPVRPLRVWLRVSGQSRADSIARTIKKLRRLLVVDLVTRTGVVKVSFTARTPVLAQTASDTLLGLINAFVGRDLRTRAGATRRFLQDRLGEIEGEFAIQEDKLKAFLEANRDYRNSPALQFREAELQRDLDLKRDIYVSVARSLEEARINEVRDTPLISIIDRPSLLTRPTSPKPLLNGALLALFMPVAWLAFALVWGGDFGRRRGRADGQ